MKSLFEHYDGMSSVKWRSSWTLGIGQGISFLGSLKWSRRANKQVSRESWYDIWDNVLFPRVFFFTLLMIHSNNTCNLSEFNYYLKIRAVIYERSYRLQVFIDHFQWMPNIFFQILFRGQFPLVKCIWQLYWLGDESYKFQQNCPCFCKW